MKASFSSVIESFFKYILALSPSITKRIFSELAKLQHLEPQDKFILHTSSSIDFGNTTPPRRFNNTEVVAHNNRKDAIVIQGRLAT